MKKNRLGERFGRLLIIEAAENQIFPCGQTASAWKCQCECGKELVVNTNSLRRGFTKSCGCLRTEILRAKTGDKSPSWKGGRSLTKDGYVKVNAGPNRGKPEHVAIMEKFLGRELKGKETVHHKNGVRDDNRIENLELWSSQHPSGQRIKDKVKWAKELLQKYEPGALVESFYGYC